MGRSSVCLPTPPAATRYGVLFPLAYKGIGEKVRLAGTVAGKQKWMCTIHPITRARPRSPPASDRTPDARELEKGRLRHLPQDTLHENPRFYAGLVQDDEHSESLLAIDDFSLVNLVRRDVLLAPVETYHSRREMYGVAVNIRHSFATLWIESGESAEVLQKVLATPRSRLQSTPTVVFHLVTRENRSGASETSSGEIGSC